MSFVILDRVRETAQTTGTGNIFLLGPLGGYRSFSLIGDGNTTYYVIVLGSQWEVGIGTYVASNNSLARTTVLSSSNNDALVNFASGIKDVILSQPAERAVFLDSATNATIPGITLSGGTANGVTYLNGSKVLTTGTALTFDGTNLGIGTSSPAYKLDVAASVAVASITSSSTTAGNQPTLRFQHSGNNTYQIKGGTNLQFLSDDGANERMRLDNAGNLGLGVTPSAWGGSNKAIDIGTIGNVSADAASMRVVNNAYSDSGGTFRYKTTAAAFSYVQNPSLGHTFFTAPSGTAGNAISFTQAMTLNASGNLLLGTTSDSVFGRNIVLDGVGSCGLSFRVSTSSKGFIYADANDLQIGANTGAIIFKPADIERVRIDSSGNLLVGGTTSNGKLNIYANGATSAALSFYDTNTGGRNWLMGPGVGTASANQFNWYDATASATRMTLDSSGNLGIGTSSPAARLDIQGGNIVVGTTTAGNSTTSMTFGKVAAGGGTINNRITLATYGTLYGAYMEAYANLNASTATYLAFGTTAGGGGSPTERMRIDDVGNLGIGTSSPAAKLDVVSTGAGVQYALNLRNDADTSGVVGTAIHLGYASPAANYGTRIVNYGNPAVAFAGELAFERGNGTGYSESMRIDTSGNLGIGTSSPAAKLESRGADAAARFRGSSIQYLDVIATSGGAVRLDANNGSAFVFAQNTAEQMRLNSSGNLLVGTTVTNFNSRITSYSTSSYTLESIRTGTGSEGHVAFVNANGAVGTIFTNGITTAYNTSSDYRLKNITGPITNSGAYIDSLNPVEGTWKADGSTFVGLIAHEVQEASRTVVATGTKDGEQMQGMDYSSAELITNLIAEVKALRTRVAALESN